MANVLTTLCLQFLEETWDRLRLHLLLEEFVIKEQEDEYYVLFN
jgi:hypothetical protein